MISDTTILTTRGSQPLLFSSSDNGLRLKVVPWGADSIGSGAYASTAPLINFLDGFVGIKYDTKMIPDIVLDTNVLVSALKSRQGSSFRLLSQVGDGRFQLHLSVPLVVEYEAMLKRGGLALSDIQVDDVIDYLCAQAIHNKIFYLWRPKLKDPDDDFVLELSVKARATIVTWNVADFRNARNLGVSVVTPREFLASMEGRS